MILQPLTGFTPAYSAHCRQVRHYLIALRFPVQLCLNILKQNKKKTTKEEPVDPAENQHSKQLEIINCT